MKVISFTFIPCHPILQLSPSPVSGQLALCVGTLKARDQSSCHWRLLTTEVNGSMTEALVTKAPAGPGGPRCIFLELWLVWAIGVCVGLILPPGGPVFKATGHVNRSKVGPKVLFQF